MVENTTTPTTQETSSAPSAAPQKTEVLHGRCICGTLTYDFDCPIDENGKLPGLGLCHCTLCHVGMGAFSTNILAPLSSLRITSTTQPKICVWRTEPKERALQWKFCPDCGVMLWSEPAFWPGMGALKPGTLLRFREFDRVEMQINMDKKVPWLKQGTSMTEGEEGCFGGHLPGVEELGDAIPGTT